MLWTFFKFSRRVQCSGMSVCCVIFLPFARFIQFFYCLDRQVGNLDSKVTDLSDTRWTCRTDAVGDYVNNFEKFYVTLMKISQDVEQKAEVRQEAAGLLKGMTNLENAFMAIFWNKILNRFHATSQYLQKVSVDLITANSMLLSLVGFVSDLRNEFESLETAAKALSESINQDYSDSNKRRVTQRLTNRETQKETLHGSEKFKIQSKLAMELKNRSDAYSYITNLFGFLTRLLTIDGEELGAKVEKLVEVYSSDLSADLLIELKQFIPQVKIQNQELPGYFSNRSDKKAKENDNTICPILVLKWIIDNDMAPVFPNVYIAYRLLVTIPIANCESERSFSVLKRIKDLHRSTMGDERLSALALLTIENELLRLINFDDLIKEFAEAKSRKKII